MYMCMVLMIDISALEDCQCKVNAGGIDGQIE